MYSVLVGGLGGVAVNPGIETRPGWAARFLPAFLQILAKLFIVLFLSKSVWGAASHMFQERF